MNASPAFSAPEIEASLLGSVLRDEIGKHTPAVLEVLPDTGALTVTKHRAIYAAIIDLAATGKPTHIAAVFQLLADRVEIEQAGGADYLTELVDLVPHSIDGPYYARLIRDKARRRQIVAAAEQALAAARDTSIPDAEIAERVEAEIFGATHQVTAGTSSDPADIGAALQREYDAIADEQDGKAPRGLLTGLADLDQIKGGVKPGEVVIVAARPSMGKTSLALNIAEHVVTQEGAPVAVFSLEMSRQELARRILVARAGVNTRGRLGEGEYRDLQRAIGDLSGRGLIVDDTAGLTLPMLQSRARRLVSQHGVKLIVLDYLQLMSVPQRETRNLEVGELSRGLKVMARELGVCVLALSQVSRGVENRTNRRPTLADLRDSGCIEQDADAVLFIFRPAYYARHDDPTFDPGTGMEEAEIIVAKHRNGPTGTARVYFDPHTTTFRSIDHAAARLAG